jgi:intracellular sulfur oxidation DsrE/DsrF family protein
LRQLRRSSSSAQSKLKVHHVVIQVDQNDQAVMNLALNNADNMRTYYEGKGERVEIELVAFGPGLSMMRADTSPVKDRLAALSKQGVKFSGCGNTKANQSKAENREITLLAEAREVPTGVARITELQEQSWTYLRPS